MISCLERMLAPLANKLGNQRHLQAISNGMMMSLASVSYTHLDVYKRQMGNFTYTARFATMDEVNAFVEYVLE